MIAKGNLHGNGAKLARYLMTGEKGEIAELVEARGLEFFGPDPVHAFTMAQRVAEAETQCTKPFFHGHIRLAPGERLSDEQWMEAVDRAEKRLGFTGQPRIVSFHIDAASGDKHLHVGWFRIDLETMHAIDPGLYKNHLKQLSRTLEKDFALREVSNYRKPDDRTQAPGRGEFEESRRLKTDLKAIRNTILDCLQQSDTGKAFNAALETRGLMLANGDRRDCFVVIDQAGGQHALNKRLTGLTLAATRDRLADLDRQQLPGVEEGKARQRARHAEHAAEIEKNAAAARGPYAELRTPEAPAPETKTERPLGKTAAEIHTVWNATRSAQDFACGIEERGLILVYVTAEEARASERAHAFVKAIDRQNRALKEGFAVIDQRGNATRIDQRATGELEDQIKQHLSGIERDKLLSVAAAREVMKEANRAAWQTQQQEEREKARPPSSIEARIIECAEQARLSGAAISRDGEGRRLSKAEALAARFDKTGARVSEAATVFGPEAFAARLDEAGIAIVRVTAADVTALAALRQDEKLAHLAAETNREARKDHSFAELQPGDIAAVTGGGDVHRINPDKLRGVEITATPPSVTEARAAFEIEGEKVARLWAQRRDNVAAEREAYAADREERTADARAARGVEQTAQAIQTTAGRGLKTGFKVLGRAAKVFETGFNFVFGWAMAGPKPTRQQAHDKAKSRGNVETQHARDVAAAALENEAAHDERQHVQKTADQQKDLSFSARFGTPPTREANLGRDLDDDYGRER